MTRLVGLSTLAILVVLLSGPAADAAGCPRHLFSAVLNGESLDLPAGHPALEAEHAESGAHRELQQVATSAALKAAVAAGKLTTQSPLGKSRVNTLGALSKPTVVAGMAFNDAWGPKIMGTPEGDTYDPGMVDWASVIEAVRVVCKYEMRICNWCTRSAFHDGGSTNEVGQVPGSNKKVFVTVPPGGGFDASLLLTQEQLRPENSYDSFSTFVAAVIRKLVGFYNISYTDGLAVCGAVAREMLTYGRVPVYTMMPAKDKTNKKTSTVDFVVGRLDTAAQNNAGVLPGADFNVGEFAAYFKESGRARTFNRGLYDAMALMGSHATLDNWGCVQSANPAYPGVNRMFTWDASNTYYRDLATASLTEPFDPEAVDAGDLFLADVPKPILSNGKTIEQCKFTSADFQARVGPNNLTPIGGGLPNGGSELSFKWVMPAGDPSGIPQGVTRRTCYPQGLCVDGWPYTQNDGFLGVAVQTPAPGKGTFEEEIKTAVMTFIQDESKFHAAYGNVFNRLTTMGSMFSPLTAKYQPRGQLYKGGLPITGWECATWLSGDGNDPAANKKCQRSCKKGCPTMYMVAPYMCRCSSAPWGDVAKQKLYPESIQTAIGGINVSPSGDVTGGR